MSKTKGKYSRNLLLSATEISIIHQGVKVLIYEQLKAIRKAEEPYLTTLSNYFEDLQKLKRKLYKHTMEIEDEVLNDLKKLKKKDPESFIKQKHQQ